MRLQILCGQLRASVVWRDASGGGCLLWECAAGQLKTTGGPCARFLLGAEVHDHQQALQLEHGALETHVACFRFHVAEVAEFERRERAVRFEGFPDHAGVVSNAALGIEARMIARLDGGFAHG